MSCEAAKTKGGFTTCPALGFYCPFQQLLSIQLVQAIRTGFVKQTSLISMPVLHQTDNNIIIQS